MQHMKLVYVKKTLMCGWMDWRWGNKMNTINEIEKRQKESKQHIDLAQSDVLAAFYRGKAAAFVETIQILKGEARR
jgi:hypothetical protein